MADTGNSPPRSATSRRAPIAMLTDFGYRDHYVGVMKGVIAAIAPRASIVDVTHGIPPQQVAAGAIALNQCLRFFPRRTVFVAVVDPGVGTARLPIALETQSGMRMVGPDNGLLSLAGERAGIRAMVELRAPRYRLQPVSASFHGRDIFAPAAAWLWRGLPLHALGPRLERIVGLTAPLPLATAEQLCGEVIYVDGFGNLITNVSRAMLERFAARAAGCRLVVRFRRHAPFELRKTYGEVRQGLPLAMFGSFDLLEVAVREGNAAAYFAVRSGEPITIRAQRTRSARR